MSRKSKIDRLPPEVRELIGELRTQRGYTIDEILAHLRGMDVQVGRSGLGLHTQQLDAIHKQLRHSRAVAEALVARLGDAPESSTGRFNIELLHGILMRSLAGEDGEGAAFSPQELMFLSSAMQKLSAAAKSDVDRELKIRKEVVGKVGKSIEAGERDLSQGKQDPAAVLKRIREEVYGILS